MKRIFLFIATNMAVMIVIGIILSVLGISGNPNNLAGLLAFSAVVGFTGSIMSLMMSKWMAKKSTGAYVIEQPRNETEAWLLNIVDNQARQLGLKRPEVAIYDAPEENAFATGPSKNNSLVAVSTGLLHGMTREEVEAVLAHELGHFHHKHIFKRMALMLPLSLAVFALLGYVSRQLWFYEALGLNHAVNALSALSTQPTQLFAVGLVLFSLVLPVFAFIFSPIASNGSRKDEFQADAFAVKNSNGQDLINALVAMYQENSSFVGTDALYSLFYDSHPPALIRVARIQALLRGAA